MRHAPRRAVLALLAGGLAGCFSDRPATAPEPPDGGGPEVVVENFAFVPPTLTVASGTTITWTNHDDVPHTVTADDGDSFGSDIFNKDGTYQLVAPAPGTYPYHCQVHPFMKGTLTVTPP